MKSLYRKVILLLLFLEICLPGRADTLIVTKERPWHAANQVSQAVIVKTTQDRIGYIAAKDATGKETQFNKSLVIVAYEIPELIPPKAFDKGQYDRLQEAGKRLNDLSESNPKIQAVLKSYLSEFTIKIQPELQRFERGDIKTNGIWITGAEYKAKIEAEQQRKIQEKLADDKRRIETIRATEERRQKEKRLAQIRWEAQKAENERIQAAETIRIAKEAREKTIQIAILSILGIVAFAGIIFLLIWISRKSANGAEFEPVPTIQEVNLTVGYGLLMCVVGIILSPILIGIPILLIGIWTAAFPEAAIRRSRKQKQ